MQHGINETETVAAAPAGLTRRRAPTFVAEVTDVAMQQRVGDLQDSADFL